MAKLVLIILGLILVILWLASFIVINSLLPDISDSWAFWDSFWAINSLFSGLAFLWLIYTVLLQTKQLKVQEEELRLQRKELKMTREELAKSADAQDKQVNIQVNLAKLTAYSALLSKANKWTNIGDLNYFTETFANQWKDWETTIKREIRRILSDLDI